jgi:hypothetical protein
MGLITGEFVSRTTLEEGKVANLMSRLPEIVTVVGLNAQAWSEKSLRLSDTKLRAEYGLLKLLILISRVVVFFDESTLTKLKLTVLLETTVH